MIGFGNAVGNLFDRIGKIGSIVKAIRICQVSNTTNLIDPTTGLVTQFASEPDIQSVVGSNYISILNSFGSPGALLQSLAIQCVNRVVYRDNPQQGQTLTSANTLGSLQEIIKQMNQAGVTVLAIPVTVSSNIFIGINNNVGNGIVNSSIVRPIDIRQQENSFSETVTLICQGDSYTGTATQGNEPFAVYGQGSQSNVFSYQWPMGSGSFSSVSAIDGNSSNTNGNILTNSGFETFTLNIPNNFIFDIGIGGTNVFEEDTLVFDPLGQGKALRLLGDGLTLINFRQLFNSSDGTLGTLSTSSNYSFCMWLRYSGSVPSTGTLEIALIDGLGNYVKDNLGNNQFFTVDLTGLSEQYSPYKGTFNTPAIIPSTYQIRYRLTTAISSGTSIYIDKTGLGSFTQLYLSGPYFAIHSGAVPFQIGDETICSVVNSRGIGGTLDTFQTLWQRLFYNTVMGNELLLPSSNVPFLVDSAFI